MKIFIDTNILLDIALNRKPFVEAAKLIWKIVENKFVSGYISATTITDIHYICRKNIGKEKSKAFITDLIEIFEIIDADKKCIQNALKSDISDFEDAIQFEISNKIKCNYIITRNCKDFKNTTIAVTPDQLIALLKRE